jgi:hypothetical protein
MNRGCTPPAPPPVNPLPHPKQDCIDKLLKLRLECDNINVTILM